MKFYKVALLSTVAALLVAVPVLAFLYQAPFTIIESAGTDYDMFPALVGANNTFMAANGFMEADALDTRVETLAGSDKPHMVADDFTLGAVPVEANSQTNLFFTTGETDLTSMDILAGFEGYNTIEDDPSIELDDDFTIQFTDTFINTDEGEGKELYYKPGASRFYVSEDQELTYELSEIPGEWDTVAPQLNGQVGIRSLAVYDAGGGDRLYGGTSATGRLFEWDNVSAWVEVAPQLNGQATITALVVFNNRLYGSASTGGRLFQWNDVDAWVEVAPQLAGEDILDIEVFDGQLYGGTSAGGKLYRWNGTDAWVEVAPLLGAENGIFSLEVFNGKLYGGTNPLGKLYEWNGTNLWVEVAPQLNGQIRINDLLVYRGELYGGTSATGRLFRWDGVSAWTQVAAQFAAEVEVERLVNYNGELFGSTSNLGNLLKWDDVSAWGQAASQSGAETRVRSLAVFNNTLYGGTDSLGTLVEYQNPADSVLATGIASGEHDISAGTFARGDISTYDAGATIAVNTGAGILPVRLLEEQTLTAAAASVTFSNIDTAVAAWDTIAGVTSRHLVVVVNATSDQATAAQVVNYRFNGDSGNNYNYQELNGTAAVATASRTTAASSSLFTSISGTTTVDAFDGGTILVPHAFNIINHKATLSLGGASETIVQEVGGRWADTSAITSFTIFPTAGNFVAGSTFQLGVVDERYLVEEQLLSSAGTITFTGIVAGSGDLTVVGYGQSTNAGGFDSLLIAVNNDLVNANYFNQGLAGIGAGTSAILRNNRTIAGMFDSLSANQYSAFLLSLSQYAGTTDQVHGLLMSGDSVRVEGTSLRWANVAAVTRLDFTGSAAPNLSAGSLFSLYRVPQFVIQRTTLAAPAASVTFSNIPQGYEALQIQVYARSAVAALLDDVTVSFNTDVVAANYDFQTLDGQGAVVTAARNAASRDWMPIPGNTSGANEFGGGTLTLNQYAASDRHKHGVVLGGRNEDEVAIFSARWEDTAPITDIVLTTGTANNFMTGSVFELVGVMPSVELQIRVDTDILGASDGNVPVTDNANAQLIMGNGFQEFQPYAGVYEQSGQALHFDDSGSSEVAPGVLHNAAPKLWVSTWFKVNSTFDDSVSTDWTLWTKRINANDRILLKLENATGRLRFFFTSTAGGGVAFDFSSTETSWAADQWFHVISSISSAAGARIVVDGGAAVTDANTTALFNGGDFGIGTDIVGGGSVSVEGAITTVAVGTDDLTTAEEVSLFGGGFPSRSVIPADADNIWYLDEGTGVVAVDSGLDGDNGVIDAANTWVADGSAFRIWYQPINIVENTQEASTADAGTALTLTDAILTQIDDFWIGAKLIIVTTTDTFAPQGESSIITDFVNATGQLTFGALTAVVDAGDTYTIDFGTLVDRASTPEDARITWGFAPTGVLVTIGSMVASSQPIIGQTEEDPARDILPPISVSDWFGDGTVGGTTLTNPIRPLITAMSDNTTLTEIQVWRLMGIIAVLFATVATAFTVRGHQGITAIVAGTILGGLVAFDHNIFPMWTLVMAAGLLIAGVVAERSPSL